MAAAQCEFEFMGGNPRGGPTTCGRYIILALVFGTKSHTKRKIPAAQRLICASLSPDGALWPGARIDGRHTSRLNARARAAAARWAQQSPTLHAPLRWTYCERHDASTLAGALTEAVGQKQWDK